MTGGFRCLQVFGTATAPPSFNTNTVFRNNTCTDGDAIGIFIGSYARDVVCENNIVTMENPPSHPANLNYRGILIQGVGTIFVRNNTVDRLTNPLSTETYIGIIAIPVVPTGLVAPPTTVNIINNCVTLMETNSDAGFIGGIAPLSTTPPNTTHILQTFFTIQ